MRFSVPGRSSAFPAVFLIAAFATLLGMAGSCARPPQRDLTSARAAITSASGDLSKAFVTRDPKALALLYTEDAKMLPPNEGPVLGRDAIEKYWGSLLALPIQSLTLETVEIYGTPEEATEEGRYTMLGPNGETVESGKTLIVWRKTDVGWKIHRDMWSSNAPATAPAASDTTGGATKG